MTRPPDSLEFAAARRAMIDSQLRPLGVIDRGVLAAMGTVPRERFIPAEQWPIAYADVVVPIGKGRALSPPIVLGRLLSALEPRPGERALVVGAATGYSAAVLAEIGLDVVALDQDLLTPSITRVQPVTGPLHQGWAANAPYDLILIDSAIAALPDAILAQLGDGGRLGAVVKEQGVCRLVVGSKVGDRVGMRSIADVNAAELPGFERPVAFTF